MSPGRARPAASVFDDVFKLIDAARGRAFAAVNTELVRLYWQVGEHISGKLASAEWGDAVVDQLAAAIARRHPGLRGFTRRNLFRMRQFYETYRREKKVSALLTQLPWTHHLIVMGQAKTAAEREFYLRLAIKERWGSRELERQLRVGLFARATSKRPKVSAALARLHPTGPDAFKDAYFVEFLDLPPATPSPTCTAAFSKSSKPSSSNSAATSATSPANSACRWASGISPWTFSSTIAAFPAWSPST